MIIQKKLSLHSLSYFIACCLTLAFTAKEVRASHSTSRYFPLLESNVTVHLGKPKKNTFAIDSIYTTASTAFKRGGGTAGFPELWGEYDLDQVVKSLNAVQATNPAYVNPIEKITGATDLIDKTLKFRVDEKMKSVGFAFAYTHWFFDHKCFVGAWVPVMHMQGMTRYHVRQGSLLEAGRVTGRINPFMQMGMRDTEGLEGAALRQAQEENRIAEEYNKMEQARYNQEVRKLDLLVDKIRRETHQYIGFHDNAWSAGGFGDVDFFLGYHYYLDHEFLMRSLNILPKVGVLIPTGIRRDRNNPSSVPLMGDGHWGMYGQVHAQFELKQDLRVGLFASGNYQFARSKEERISYFKEPAIFSAVKGTLRVRPGATAMIAPYIILENITEGLQLVAKYTYLRHAADSVKDVRPDKSVASYLTQTAGGGVTQEEITNNIAHKKNLTKWRSHYITLQLMLEGNQALAKWNLKPNFYVNYDIPFGGNGISKTHQVTVGAALNF